MNSLEQLSGAAMGGSRALETLPAGTFRLPIAFVNAYFVRSGDGWVLVDSGLPGFGERIQRTAIEKFGAGARPTAIVLTHGHFDHAGSALELAEAWDIPIFAHRLETPYLNGLSDYPPQDPTIGGAISFLSRFFPSEGYDFGHRLHALPEDGSVPGLPGWRWIHTPGHTAGHISLMHDETSFLLAGDALTTMDLDSWTAQVTYRQELDRPPAPMTPDWVAARSSVQSLAELDPRVIAAGHGIPIRSHAAMKLRRFAQSFPEPPHGRYVEHSAGMDERGVVSLPPPVTDPLPRQLAVGLAAAGVAALITTRFRD